MPPLPEFKTHFIKYDKLDSDSPLLSMPTISKKNGELKCNYNKITFQKGPFCPELYSKPIILNIVSLVDEEINAEIKEIQEEEENTIVEDKNEDEDEDEGNDKENDKKNDNDNNNEMNKKLEEEKEVNKYKDINSGGEEENEEENENSKEEKDSKTVKNEENKLNEDIPIRNRKDIDSYKYMKVKNYIQSKEPIQIEIYIPNIISKGKKEIQKIRRILKLTAGYTACEIEIEMQILTIPIQLLFSCENYKLEFKNGSYYLKTNQLFSSEKLIFKIQNYIKGDNNKIKTRIESLEGNTSKEPKINIEEENSIIVNMPSIENNEVKRINCKIECYISQNYKIPIIIDCVIIPINYAFQIYDYRNHVLTSNSLSLLLPTGNYSNCSNFKKYFPDNKVEINLHLFIIIPFRQKKIKAIIKARSKSNYNNIKFEFEKKEIDINEKKN